MLSRIPVILLHERFDVLKEAILAVWNKPQSSRATSVFRRLVWYYAEMLSNRRAGDRNYKRQAVQKNEAERPAITVPIIEQIDQRCNAPTNQFAEIAIRAAQAEGHEFDFGEDDWDARIVQEAAGRIVFDITCPARRIAETIDVSTATFTRIGLQLQREAAS